MKVLTRHFPMWRVAALVAAVLCAVAFGTAKASAAGNCTEWTWDPTINDYFTVCTYTGGSMGATSRWFYIYNYKGGYQGYYEQNLSGNAVFWCPANGSCRIAWYWR